MTHTTPPAEGTQKEPPALPDKSVTITLDPLQAYRLWMDNWAEGTLQFLVEKAIQQADERAMSMFPALPKDGERLARFTAWYAQGSEVQS